MVTGQDGSSGGADPRAMLGRFANEHDEWVRLIVRHVLDDRRQPTVKKSVCEPQCNSLSPPDRWQSFGALAIVGVTCAGFAFVPDPGLKAAACLTKTADPPSVRHQP
jgi:hypothetical protein